MTATKRNGNVWAKVLVGVVGAAAAIWIIVTSLGASATGAWQAYAASLRAKGQPLTFAEIESRRALIPDDQNSARVIESLTAALAEQRGGAITLNSLVGTKEAGDVFAGLRKSQIASGREFLSKHSDILAKLEKIHDMPSGRFSVQYDKVNPLATLLPHVDHLRQASKLLRLSSTIHLVDADRATALREFELQCRLAGALQEEPTLISRLVQIAVQTLAVQHAEALFRTGELDAAALELISRELNGMRTTGTLKWGLLGERAFFAETCDSMIAGTMLNADVCAVGGDCHLFPGNLLRIPTFLVRANQLRGATMHSSLIEAVDDPKALLAAAKKIETEVPTLPKTQMLVKILMPSLTRAIVLNTKMSAQLDCAIAAVAAERFRLAQGNLPSTLEQLVPAYLSAVPIDPFDGKPLRMAKSDQGIVIYSVDENGVDDGGDLVVRKEGVKKQAPDLGFRLNNPDHRGVLIIDDPVPSDE